MDIFAELGDLLRVLFSNLGAGPTLAGDLVTLLSAVVLATFVLVILVFNIWFERKVIGRFQDRIGPNRVGPWGLFQTVADLAKLATKEFIIPAGADLIPFLLAPLVAVSSVIMIWAVLPFTPAGIGTDVSIGALYIMSVSSLGILAILMAGWASNNKYALLGAFRGVAMLVSYEVPLILALMIPVMLTGSMRINDIVAAQNIAYVFSVPVAALIFYIASVAEVGRTPFDLLEAESEIVAGYQIEYSGFAFGIFYAAEWAHGFTICALTAVLFLGGWRGPFVEQFPSLGLVYFMGKTFLVYFFNVWTRATLPRMRIDQIMNFCWKFLVPVSLLLLVLIMIVDKAVSLSVGESYLSYLTVEGAGNAFVASLPRAGVLLLINGVVAALAFYWIALTGRKERERLDALEHNVAPVEHAQA